MRAGCPIEGDTALASAEAIFDRRWARCVADEAARRTARRFELRGQGRAWQAFEWTTLRAGATGVAVRSGHVVARELGYRCAADVAEASRAVRLELRRCFHEVVAEGMAGESMARDVAAVRKEVECIQRLLR